MRERLCSELPVEHIRDGHNLGAGSAHLRFLIHIVGHISASSRQMQRDVVSKVGAPAQPLNSGAGGGGGEGESGVGGWGGGGGGARRCSAAHARSPHSALFFNTFPVGFPV
jgi:hypothetical protein